MRASPQSEAQSVTRAFRSEIENHSKKSDTCSATSHLGCEETSWNLEPFASIERQNLMQVRLASLRADNAQQGGSSTMRGSSGVAGVADGDCAIIRFSTTDYPPHQRLDACREIRSEEHTSELQSLRQLVCR